MESLKRLKTPLVGRKKEIDQFSEYLERAKDGKGGTLSLVGGAGIGKSRLVEKFLHIAETKGFELLEAKADENSSEPFDLFSQALKDEVVEPFVSLEESTSFAEIFAVNDGGMLLATARPEGEEEIDGDIFAGMLSAVQNFVKDSFGGSGSSGEGLGRLEYGDMKIMIEHGDSIYVAAVVKGNEHPDMKLALQSTVRDIEREDSDVLEGWSGGMDEMESIQNKISVLSNNTYLVRKDLEGLKLENERVRVSDRILNILSKKEVPLVISLEDLHLSDESSLFVLDYLSRSIDDKDILILCTRRPQESELADKVIKVLQNEDFLTDAVLRKLETDDIESLVDELFNPNEFPDTLVSRLSKECQGNPFFMIEMLKQMEKEGAIEFVDGCYQLLVENFTIPVSLEEVVYRRLELLDPGSLALIEYISCEGLEIRKGIPESLNRPSDIEGPLTSLVDSGIIIHLEESLAFTHAIFRDVIYDSLSRWWRNSYHHQLGEYYENSYRDRITDVYYDLARHFSNTIDHSKAHDYSFKAGEKAENSLAPEQAIDFYNRSLDALNKIRSIEDKVQRNFTIVERLGDMRSLLGDLDEALEHYNGSLELAGNSLSKATIHRKLGKVFMTKGEYDRSIEVCDTGLEFLDSDDIEVAKIKRVKGRTHMRTGDYDVSLELLNQAFEIAEKNKGKKEMAEIAHNQGTVEWYRGRYVEALERLEYSLDLRKEMADSRGIAKASTNIGLVYYSTGDKRKALENYKTAMVSFKDIGDKLNLATVYNNIGMAYFSLGELERAEEYFDMCLDLFERVGDKSNIAMSMNNLGLVLQNMGYIERSLNFYRRSLHIREDIGDKQGMAMSLYNIGNVYLDIDKIEDAVDHMNQALAISSEIENQYLSTEIRCDMAIAYVKMGELDTARKNAMNALDISIDIGSDSLEGASRSILGTVFREKGEWKKSIEEFEKARKILEKGDEIRDLAELYYEYGLLLKELDDKDKSKKYFEKALELQKELKLEKDIDRTQKMLHEICE